jgi:hypothetical protein
VFVCATTMGKNGRSAASTHKNWRIWMWFLDKLSPAVTHNADTDETRRKPRIEREREREQPPTLNSFLLCNLSIDRIATDFF